MKFIRKNIIIVLLLAVLSMMTIGYAIYGETINLNGNITIPQPGIIEITDAYILSNECSGLDSYNNPTYSGMHIEFRIDASRRNTNFTATYVVTVSNNSFYNFTYTGFPVNATIEGESAVPNVTTTITRYDTGEILEAGEIIESGEEITVKVKMDFSVQQNPNGLTVVVNGTVSASEDNSGNIMASINPNTGDLRGEGTMAEFELSVINTFKYNRTFNLSSSNENIIIVDSNGDQISNFSISANVTENYPIYLMVKKGSIFLTDQTQTNIIVSSNMIDDIDTGTINLAVDIDINATDHEKPEVGNISIAISENNPTDGQATISWSRIDSGGSPITNYYITLYNETTGTSATYETGNAITSYTFTGLSPGNYYATVYGVDEAGNSGVNDCESATTGNGYCSKSATTNLQWLYNVTTDFDRLESNGQSTALIYSSYEATLSLTTNIGYALPSSITITMNGTTLSSGTDYTYDSSSGRIVINKVTGDIHIVASAENNQCLVEGTKILLADGTTENIEDIDYDDLLMVYDHENGGFTYEYPIWIEKGKTANNYQKITFSDGSTLNTFGTHGIFSADLNKYVNVLNKNEFHVGTNIIKFNSDGSRKIVTVTNIETVEEEINYYYIASTRYYNVIAEGYLTNNGLEFTSFLYSFDSDLTWGIERDEFLAQNDLFHYEDWKEFFPKYLFYGLRMEEAKNILNHGLLDVSLIISKLDISNTKEIIKNNNGNILWMVTTSDDLITEENKSSYLREYESTYVLPEPKDSQNFIGWLNTSDNKIYQPGDEIEVIYGIHFIALYE